MGKLTSEQRAERDEVSLVFQAERIASAKVLRLGTERRPEWLERSEVREVTGARSGRTL